MRPVHAPSVLEYVLFTLRHVEECRKRKHERNDIVDVPALRCFMLSPVRSVSSEDLYDPPSRRGFILLYTRRQRRPLWVRAKPIVRHWSYEEPNLGKIRYYMDVRVERIFIATVIGVMDCWTSRGIWKRRLQGGECRFGWAVYDERTHRAVGDAARRWNDEIWRCNVRVTRYIALSRLCKWCGNDGLDEVFLNLFRWTKRWMF